MITKNDLFSRINQGVVDERLEAFWRNVKKNRPLIRKFGGLRKILPRFNLKNVIIIGAGPSLEANIDLLKKYQKCSDIVLVAADMSLRILMRNGIIPSFVFSCETTPVDFFSGFDTSGMHLAAFSCMSHSNLMKWSGDVSFYNWMLDDHAYGDLWDYAGRDLGFLATASIITTQAVAFSLGASVSTIMMVGNDLGFTDRFYARGSVASVNRMPGTGRLTTLESAGMDNVRKRREYHINRGGSIFCTNNQFLAAKMWLEEVISSSGVPVYDCSVPGCSEKYVRKSTLKEYMSIVQKMKTGDYGYDSIA